MFIGNISTAIIHEILLVSVKSEEVASYYQKEIDNAINRSKKYREKINPVESPLPSKDVEYIKSRIINRVKADLQKRKLEGYKNVDLSLIDSFIDKSLKETKIN